MMALKALTFSVRGMFHIGREALPGRAKEDATEDDDQCCGEDERIEWHFVFRVDFCEEATRGKPTVSAHIMSMCKTSFQIARR